MQKICLSLQRSLSLILSFALTFFPLFANPIVINPNSLNTSLDKTNNGVDIVNIATPDKHGISNNLYLEFNVKESGLVFNNSNSALTPSVLGGIITANPNLINPASLILNQITSTSPSILLGMMEIAGSTASLLIANPNGITCQGCGFINANNVTLATGLPQIKDNGYIEFNIQRGAINLNSLNALGSQSLNLLAKNLSINSELYANALIAILGSNQITLDEKGSLLLWQPILREDHTASLALDVTHLGRVYANSIFILANNEGVEARIEGIMATRPSQKEGDGGFYLDINGDLKISSKTQEKQEASLFSSSQMQIKATNLENGGNIISSGDSTIQTQNLKNHSIISSNQTLSLNSSEITNHNALIQGNNLTIHSDKIINSQGFILAQENVFIQANEIENRAKIELQEEKISQEHITIGRWADYDQRKRMGRFFSFSALSYLKGGDKDYAQSIYEDKIQSYTPSMFYAGNTLAIRAEVLDNMDGQIGGEKLTQLDVSNLNNHTTQAQRKTIQTGREAKYYTVRVKCHWLDFSCRHKNETRFDVFAYNPSAQITQVNLELPSFSDNLALAPNTQDLNVFGSYNPQESKAEEITEGELKDFISSNYFKDRFISLTHQTQEDFLSSLSLQERSTFIASLNQNDQNYLLNNFNNIHLDSFSSTLALQKLSTLLPLNQRLNQDLQERYIIQNQQDKNFILSLPLILSITSSSLSGNIGGENVYIQAKILNNEGIILASRGIFAQTQEKILNSGNIEADNISLSSNGEISNIGGKLQAKENLALNADTITTQASIFSEKKYQKYPSFF